jgi:hypothetical protein
MDAMEVAMTTVFDLFFDKPAKAQRELTSRLAKTGLMIAPLTGALEASLVGQIGREVANFLDMPVDDLLCSAWDKHQLVREALEHTRGRPDAVTRVTILQHRLTSTHRPRVELTADGQRYPICDIVLTLSLEVDSFVVEVRDGRVAGWGPGTASASAELAVAAPNDESELHVLARARPRVIRLGRDRQAPVIARSTPVGRPSGWPPPVVARAS